MRGAGGSGGRRFFGRFGGPGGRGRLRRHAGAAAEGQLSLAQLAVGRSGTVVEITGGGRLMQRLAAIGLRQGSKVTKVGSMFMRGPVSVRVGQTQIALGFGAARKILIRPD